MLLHLLLGTLSILLTQILVGCAIAGIGLVFRRSFGLRSLTLDDCLLAFWTGLAAVTLFLLLWNLFLPIGGWACCLILTAGALGLWGARRELVAGFARRAWRPSPLLCVLLILAALWIANLSLGAMANRDSGLYHIQVVRWAERFPAVPGIGNLDGPLAFNNSSLLFDAMLSVGPWEGRANHLANGLLVLVFLVQVIVAGARLAAGDRRPRRLFEFLLLTAGTSLALHGRVSSFVTDLPASLVVCVAMVVCYGLLSEAHREDPEADFRVVTIATLLALAVTFKTNAAILAASCFPLVMVLWLLRVRPSATRRLRTLGWALGPVLALALAWTGRGVILSGYPLFPASLGAVPVEWRVPAEHAEAEFAYIVHSGRGSTQNLPVVQGEAGLRSWFLPWARSTLDDPYELVLPLAFTLLALLASLLLHLRGGTADQRAKRQEWWLLLPLVLAVAAWFFVAPEPRYVLPYLWSLVALIGSQTFGPRLLLAPQRSVRAILVGGALLGISPVLVSPIASKALRRDEPNPLLGIIRNNFNWPGSDLWFQPMDGRPKVTPYRTRSGLLLNVARDQCWDAALPCTPNPAPNLRLRDSADLAKGFMVEGSWQMENWPLSWQPNFLAAWRKSRAERKVAPQ
jgi:hypothetical protein